MCGISVDDVPLSTAAAWTSLIVGLVPRLALLPDAPSCPWLADHSVRRVRQNLKYGVLAAWREEKERHGPVTRRVDDGHMVRVEVLEPEEIFDGWEWVANPAAPSPEVLAGPFVTRPLLQERARRARAERARRAWEADEWDPYDEAQYEGASLAAGLRGTMRRFFTGDGDSSDEELAVPAAFGGLLRSLRGECGVGSSDGGCSDDD